MAAEHDRAVAVGREHDRGRAVAEQRARDEVRSAAVVADEGGAADLRGDEQHGAVEAAAQRGGPRDAIEHFVVHPGGAKVLAAYEACLGLPPSRLASAHAVLRDFGNMSSPTALFVLDHHLRGGATPGSHGIVVGLGPGFCAEAAVFRT